MKRYRIYRDRPLQGFVAPHGITVRESRVIEIPDGGAVDDTAVAVADTEPLTEWQEIKE